MLRVVAAMMNLRSRITGIATGDQAMFMSRAAFGQAGGFPAQPLMEDIELSARLRRIGRPACLAACVVTSGRRWERDGVWRTILLMWRLRFAYWRGAPPADLHQSGLLYCCSCVLDSTYCESHVASMHVTCCDACCMMKTVCCAMHDAGCKMNVARCKLHVLYLMLHVACCMLLVGTELQRGHRLHHCFDALAIKADIFERLHFNLRPKR